MRKVTRRHNPNAIDAVRLRKSRLAQHYVSELQMEIR